MIGKAVECNGNASAYDTICNSSASRLTSHDGTLLGLVDGGLTIEVSEESVAVVREGDVVEGNK